MTDPKWGFALPTKDRARLILCATGLHEFRYCCASVTSDRDTQRECYDCGLVQTREDRKALWRRK